MTWHITESQLNELNTLLQRTDDQMVYNMVTRTAQESKLFPIMPYIDLCMFDAYYRFPDIIREVSEHLSPEEFGHRSREGCTRLSKLTAWGILNFYLNGRALLIRYGLLRPQDNLEDLWTLVDWWLRFKRSYERNNAHVWTLDAGDVAPEHSERVLQVFEADAFACDRDERLRDAVARFIATGTQYSFLGHCESRVGLHNSGPYRLGDDVLMHTRDFMNLSECGFSWLDDVAADVPYNNLTLVVITKRVAMEITDIASVYTDPESYQDRIVGVGLYTADHLSDRYEPVGMTSAGDLTSTLEDLSDVMTEATRGLYKRFAEMSFRQMTDAGMYTYVQAANPLAMMAGTYRQDDWEFVDERTERFRALFNEEYALDAYVDTFAQPQGYQAAQTDYYLHPILYEIWRKSGDDRGPAPDAGRNAFLVPLHVVNDDDYPRRVNPNGLADCQGDSSLPPKGKGFATSQGYLSEDELNAAAREFSSPLFEDPWVHLDDQWVKYHWQSDEADALYRYVQHNSRLLAGAGAGITRDDIDRRREDVGERPWTAVELS